MIGKPLLTAAAFACLVPAARGDAPNASTEASAILNSAATAVLADSLRTALLDAIPDPLYENHSRWGGQRLVTDRVKLHIHGLHIQAEAVRSLKNDGRWWKVKAAGIRLPDTLVVVLRDVRHGEDGGTTFTSFLAFDARVEYDQQNWAAGLRLFSGDADARMRVNLTLRCEATTKLEPNGTLIPDAVFRLRATEAKLSFDHFVLEHIAGVGGDLAKHIGDAALAAMEQWRPSLERNLLDRADAAIVKAADTKEERISVKKLLNGE